jgi:hypothetical protein
MTSDSTANPASLFFEALRTWAYPQVSRHSRKASFVEAVSAEANRINAAGGYGRTPRQIDAAVTNCTNWIWEKFVEGKQTASTVNRDIQLQLPPAVDQHLQDCAAALNIDLNELITRWVLARLATETATSDDLLTLFT